MKGHKIPEFSIEEYLIQERESGQKYEFHKGRIYALASSSVNHGLLYENIYAELRSQLKGNFSNFKPINSEIKLNIAQENTFVYPDTMVFCGDLELSP